MNVGIIGYGVRIDNVIGTMGQHANWGKIKAITDVNIGEVKEKLARRKIDFKNINFYTDADQMLDREELDAVLIGTRCSVHVKMAIKVLKTNLPLFLEKPVATTVEDLNALKSVYDSSKSEVVVSFPLRFTPMIQMAKEIIQTGKLGTIEHVQAVNNVPYGGGYYHNWYRDENEAGGLFLQKATHDIDYINYLLDIQPIELCAMKSKQIFKGDKAEGLKCNECVEWETCPEGPFVMKNIKNDAPGGDFCCFAKDTGNEDSGSILMRYESGMHVSYSQNFFVRKSAGLRGGRFMGYNGTMDFDFYTDEIKVYMHNSSRVETYKIGCKEMPHFGGDNALISNFLNMVKRKEKSKSPMEAGLLSALICCKAKESAQTSTFRKIIWN